MGEDGVTRLLTGSTRLGANAAVLHAVLGVHLAFFAAESTRRCASLKSGGDDLSIERCLARHDAAGRFTEIGTIEIEPDAAGK